MAEYAHGEAFMVMEYRADDGSESEWIWNSRDGVTPFVVTLKSGRTAHHANWRNDRRCVDHYDHMSIGDRYFVDLDPETALALASERVEEWWDHPQYPMKDRWATKDAAAKALAKDYLCHGGEPHLKEKVHG